MNCIIPRTKAFNFGAVFFESLTIGMWIVQMRKVGQSANGLKIIE